MLCRLAAEEFAYLMEHFRLLEKADGQERIPLSKLKDQEFLQEFLVSLQGELETESKLAAASQLMKRIGYLSVVPPLYTAAVFRKALNLDLANTYLVDRREEALWMPRLVLDDFTAVKLTGEMRDNRFKKLVHQLFNSLAEVIEAVSVAASVPKSILWENVAVYVYWLYEIRLAQESNYAVRLQGWRDFDFILNDLPSKVFNQRTNPLQKFHQEKTVTTNSGEPLRIRQTCCFAFETGSGKGYCKTCPKQPKKVYQ